MSIKVVLGGPRGQMGQEALAMMKDEANIDLVACIDHNTGDQTKETIQAKYGVNLPVYNDLKVCLNEHEVDVYIDLTIPSVGYTYTKIALEHEVRAVVGTSGFTEEQINDLRKVSKENQVGCIIAPNFALGAILMMLFAKQAAKFFPDVEIIEKHHDNKVDAPSGTAVKTLQMIHEVREEKQQGHPNEYESMEGARGASEGGVHVHSMRLPGLVAHQEVVFGSTSQLLTIKHDAFDRKAYMSGLKYAIEQVMNKKELIYGLEHVLDLN
ncbi:MAG TPA: 4-hydroxy-tetrahydrodipicolinate reductase [Pseudogracilibacillus sp.]|nr:4-hydroxy-tetrahydrodipicolinate reductase [Pseudogracilibacillus sp.]